MTEHTVAARRTMLAAAAALAASGTPILASSPFATRGPAPATTVPTHTVRQLRPTIATTESFGAFGTVLSETGRARLPINTYGNGFDLYREGFESDQPIEWFIVHARPRRREVLFLERHMQLGQTFIPLGGLAFFTIVARPGAREENGFPALDELRAFLVPGDVAIQLHRGTWHENPIPAGEAARLLVTSHANLTLAHQQNPDPRLAGLPLDLERRWYKAAGYDLTIDAG